MSPVRVEGAASRDAFLVLLWTLAEPGDIHTIPPGTLPPGVPGAALLPLALADVDVTVHIAADDDAAALVDLVSTATLAGHVPLEAAAMVVLLDATADKVLALRRGSALAPEDGARVAIRVDTLAAGGADAVAAPGGHPVVTVRLSGPGVPVERTVVVTGLDPAVLGALAEANCGFPAGVDAWLVDGAGRVVGLPRSTQITIEEVS